MARRRRLPARRGHAAVVVRGWAPTCAWRRRAPTTAATSRRNSRGSRCRRISTRASRSATRSRCTSRAACAARSRPGDDSIRRALRRHRRSLHLARALPDVAAERDRSLRAHRALLRALRHPLRRAHLLRPPLHRLRALQRDVQRRRAATSPTSGSFTCRRSRRRRPSFPDPLQSVGARESGGAALLRVPHRTAWRRWRRRRASASARKRAATRAALVGKLWIEPAKLLFLGEADFIIQKVTAASLHAEPVRLVPRAPRTSRSAA